MPRPRGGDWLRDEIGSLKRFGVNVLVSLLTSAEATELELEEEEVICRQEGLMFYSFPIPDRDVPHLDDTSKEFLRLLADKLSQGDSIGVHCRMGVGRSALVAACLITQTSDSVERAFERIGAARGLSVPDTEEQVEWVRRFTQLVT